MQAIDVSSIFAHAEHAYAGGRLEEARRSLQQLDNLETPSARVSHLRALVEKKLGNVAAARAAFEQALALADDDAQLHANYANLLFEQAETDAALSHYDRALALKPDFHAARQNRALLLHRTGQLAEALAEADRIVAAKPSDAKGHSLRAAILRDLDRLDEAAAAYDETLRIDGQRLTALHGRARVALERGEPDAPGLYIRALQQKPGDLDLMLGLVEAFEAEGNADGLAILRDVVANNPAWVIGHEVLARMRAEVGEADSFADHYEASIERRPDDLALNLSYWQVLASADRFALALEALRRAKPKLPDDARIVLTEAMALSEAGEPAQALELLDRLGAGHPGAGQWRGRIALRLGDPAMAAAALESETERDPGSITAWAHLDLAWRMLGDPRHEWLSGQPGLYAARDLALSPDELKDLAELLRGLHRTRAHPIGQSLRGGTQTRGRLFARLEPQIRKLAGAIGDIVETHFRELPPRDENHPLLRHRDTGFAIEGSWSVRLKSSGFHVSHIHPQGILSSACYISLPESLGKDDSRDGWLELGRPPSELGLPLEPLAAIEPAPGRLALFPSYLFHGTRPFSEGERLTVAFDVVAR